MKILHFADLHLGVENYGRIDPATGLSTRLLDFLAALDQLVEFALEHKIDLVLFSGDTYHSREPSQTQQREFARRISRLAVSGIPVFLLTGNHDLPNAAGKATSTEIFDTLAVKNVYVSSRPDIYLISTASGPVQVVSLPWLRRSGILSREDSRALSFEEINQKLAETLTNIITSQAAKLDSALPAVLAAHVWVSGAEVGSERLMSIGQEHVLLLSNVARPSFDYVALGHIHRHQVLGENPPVVYAGSLERVDFSEEEDDKGFYLVDIEQGEAQAKRKVSFEFHAIQGRRFVTVNVGIESDTVDPTGEVLKAIAGQGDRIEEAVVRLQISLPASLEGQLRDNEIRDALVGAYYFTVSREIRRETRLRLGDLAAEEISPQDALEKYLDDKHVPKERAKTLLKYGNELIDEQRAEG